MQGLIYLTEGFGCNSVDNWKPLNVFEQEDV